MSRSLLLLAMLLLVAPATIAHSAAVSPPGLNMRWDRCYGDGGAMYKTFACNTNSGAEVLALSMELAAPKADIAGLEIVVSLESASSTLPAWWQFKTSGSCRQLATALQTVAPAGSANCVDWADGQAAGGIGSYLIDNGGGPNYARFLCAVAVPSYALVQAQPGIEYAIGVIVINHTKTVGTGACAGCDIPVCLSFDQAKITTPTFADDLMLTNGANYQGSRIVGWQGGLTIDYQPVHFVERRGFSPATYDCVPYDVTGSRRSTWGAVKSLYR